MRYKEYKKVDIPWLNEVPSHWEIKRLNNLAKFKTGGTPKNNEGISDFGEINWITPGDFREFKISDSKQKINENILKKNNYKLFPEKSILLVCVASIGKVAIIDKPSYSNQQITAIMPYNINSEYILYYIIAIREILKNDSTKNVVPILNTSYLKNIPIPIPPKEEQEQIERFLDWKINEIDRLIHSKEKELDSLEKLIESKIERLLLFNNKVQKNMSYGDAMKSIPTIRIKNIFILRNERNLLSENEVELLSLYTKLGVLKSKDIEYKSGNKNTTVLNYKIVKENDIVVNIMLCWMGAIGVSKYDGVISPAYDVYTPNLKLVNPLYYHYFFRSNLFKNELYRNGKGIVLMKWRVYSDKFMNIRVPLFTLEQQDFILNQIENIKEKFKKKSQNLRFQINNLKLLKQSLISDVVTGKIDVRNVSIPYYDNVSDMEDYVILEESFNKEV